MRTVLFILFVSLLGNLLGQSAFIEIEYADDDVWELTDTLDYGVVKITMYKWVPPEKEEGDTTKPGKMNLTVVDIYDDKLAETGGSSMVEDERRALIMECSGEMTIEVLKEDLKGSDQQVDWRTSCPDANQVSYVRMLFTETSAHFIYIDFEGGDFSQDDDKKLEKMMKSAKLRKGL